MADPYRSVGITRSTELWHGGAPGIAVGDFIESEAALAHRGIRYGSRGVEHDAKLAYLTSDRQFARAFATRTAIFAGQGCLYRVAPVPPSSLGIDSDFAESGISFTCARARVEEVAETNIAMSARESLQVIGPHMTWADGRPIYDKDGYMSPAGNWPGADSDQVRSLGAWNQVDKVLYNARTRQAYLR